MEDVAVAVGEVVLLEGAMVVRQVKVGLARCQSKMARLNTDGERKGVGENVGDMLISMTLNWRLT